MKAYRSHLETSEKPSILLRKVSSLTNFSSRLVSGHLIGGSEASRPLWYQNYHKLYLSNIITQLVLFTFVAGVSSFLLFGYVVKPQLNLTKMSVTEQSGKVLGANASVRVFSFNGKLLDKTGSPVSTANPTVKNFSKLGIFPALEFDKAYHSCLQLKYKKV